MARTQRFSYATRLRWWKTACTQISEVNERRFTFPASSISTEDLHLTIYYPQMKFFLICETLSMWGGFTKEVPCLR